jgi:hypothetical protein
VLARLVVRRDVWVGVVGFLRREFGEDSFLVERVAADAVPHCQPAAPAASEAGR